MNDSFSAERIYEASPEQVFCAWTDIGTLSRWFGCGDDMLWRVHEWDARPGGQIRVSLEFGNGTFEVKGAFIVVDRPHHLQYRWADDEIVDVTIEPKESGSVVRLKHSWPPSDEDRAMIAQGWTSALHRLGPTVVPSLSH